MTPEDAARLAQLLKGQRLIALGVVVEGAPVVGLLQYAVSDDRGARAFLRRFPQAEATLQLGDFGLYRLELHGGRMVLGFGRALNLSREHFRDSTIP